MRLEPRIREYCVSHEGNPTPLQFLATRHSQRVGGEGQIRGVPPWIYEGCF